MDYFEKTESLLLIVIGCVFIILCMLVFTFILDDPYITFRYAANWAEGNGIVWNAGEYVEGYSNFLFLAMLMPFSYLNFDLFYMSKVLSISFGLATIMLTYLFSKKYLKDSFRGADLIAPLFLATSAHFTLWSVGGLETTLFSFLIMASCYILLDMTNVWRQVLLASSLLLLSLTRPEGPMFAIVALLVSAFDFMLKKSSRRFPVLWLPVYVVAYAIYLGWRYLYYGALIPNTYYTKTAGGLDKLILGGRYVVEFFTSQGVMFIVVALASLMLLFIKRDEVNFVFAAYLLSLFGFAVYAGGDWMPGFRFIVPALPIFFLLIQRSIVYFYHLMPGFKHRKLALAFFLLLLLPASYVTSAHANIETTPWLKDRFFAGISEQKDRPHYPVVEFLEQHASTGELVAIQETGIIPYKTLNLNYIDILGLNDRHIALKANRILHWDKGDADYVLSRKPDWLVLWVLVRPDGQVRAAMPAVSAIMTHPTVAESYRLVERLPSPEQGQPWSSSMVFFIYKKKNRKQV